MVSAIKLFTAGPGLLETVTPTRRSTTVRHADECLFKSYRVFRGAECPAITDHYLVAQQVALFPYRNSVKLSRVRRYGIQRLTTDRPRGILASSADSVFQPDDPEECWTLVRSAIHSSAN